MKITFCSYQDAVMYEEFKILIEKLSLAFPMFQWGVIDSDYTKINLDNYSGIITAGNSFGMMDGGLDLAIVERFGIHIQSRIQQMIRDMYHGELLVGEALTIYIDPKKNDLRLVYAPTMRVPQSISGTVNVYLATKGILGQISHWDGNFLFPALGRGTGLMHPKDICNQIYFAVKDFVFPIKLKWESIQQSEYQLRGGW